MKGYRVAIVGATGMVGKTFLRVLEERDFPVGELYLLASERSEGKTLTFKGKEYVVERLTENSFDRGLDIALFSAGGDTVVSSIAAKGVLSLITAVPGGWKRMSRWWYRRLTQET